MRKTHFLLLIILFPALSFSQLIRHQSKIRLDKSGTEIKFEESNFALLIGAGRSFNYNDKTTTKYLGDQLGLTFKLDMYYKEFFIRLAFKPLTGAISNQTDTIYFNSSDPMDPVSLNYPKTNIVLGYSYDMPLNFSICPYIGLLTTSFRAVDENEKEIEMFSKKIRGLTSGLCINKYIKVGNIGDYIVIYFDTNINFSNFSKYNEDLGNSFYSFEFGLAYKGWFLKKTKQY
jgi:hypothetical protein